MEKLLSSGFKQQSVPQQYILPPDRRPVKLVGPSTAAVPVIDLGNDRHDVVEQILQAGKEFGVFQVINHGIPSNMLNDMIGVTEEFFAMPIEKKAKYYSEDANEGHRLYTGTGYQKEDTTHYWRDFLKLTCYPVEEYQHQWPENPSQLRENVARYVTEVRELAIKLLNMFCEGLGFEEDYFNGCISERVIMNVNRYEPCPDPSLTLGLPKHTDPGLVTLLLQGDVSGLQALYNGEWIEVKPIENAIIINLGHQIEFVTNGILKSVEHRAITNSATSRTSIATVLMPSLDCPIAPSKSIVRENEAPRFKSFTFKEFMKIYLANLGDRESTIDVFAVKNP